MSVSDDEERINSYAQERHSHLPDTAFWRDSDVLRDHPAGRAVTVLVGGTFIGGQLASVEAWAEAMQKHGYPTVGVNSSREELVRLRDERNRLERYLDQLEHNEANLTVENNISLLAYSPFLHLIDAQSLHGGSLVPSKGVPIRIRYTEVQAWTLGMLDVTA